MASDGILDLDALSRIRKSCQDVCQELQCDIRDLQRQLKAQRRLEDKERHLLWNVALTLYIWECPDASVALRFLVARGRGLFGDDAETWQSTLEQQYLDMPVEVLNTVYESIPGYFGAEVFATASRFLLDARLVTWVAQLNSTQGIAPSYSMVFSERDRLLQSFTPQGGAFICRGGLAGKKKWVQRFRRRLQLVLSTLPPKSILPPEVLAAKVPRMNLPRTFGIVVCGFWTSGVPEIGPTFCTHLWGHLRKNKGVRGHILYLIFGSLDCQSKVRSAWQWARFLRKQVGTDLKALWLNLDETSVRYYYTPRRGLKQKPQSLAPHQRQYFQGRNTTRSQLRRAFTHIALIADDAKIQGLLPQVLLASSRIVTVAQAHAARAHLHAKTHLWRRKSGWINKPEFVCVLNLIAAALATVRHSHQPILLMDAHSVHCAPEVIKRAGELNIWICIIPAKCTHVLQPLDTDVFARYKACLRRKLLEACSCGPNADLEFPVIAAAVQQTITETISNISWRRVFARNGFGSSEYVRSSLRQLVGELDATTTADDMPTLQQFQDCFIRGRKIPFEYLLKPPATGKPLTPAFPSRLRKKTSVYDLDDVETSTWRERLRPRILPAASLCSDPLPEREILFVPASSGAASSSWRPSPPLAETRRLPILPPNARWPPRPLPRQAVARAPSEVAPVEEEKPAAL